MKQIMLMMLISISTQAQKQNAPIYTSDRGKVKAYADSAREYNSDVKKITLMINFIKTKPSMDGYRMYCESIGDYSPIQNANGGRLKNINGKIVDTKDQSLNWYVGEIEEVREGIIYGHRLFVEYYPKPIQPYFYKAATIAKNKPIINKADSLNIEHWYEPINGNPIRTAAYKVFKP